MATSMLASGARFPICASSSPSSSHSFSPNPPCSFDHHHHLGFTSKNSPPRAVKSSDNRRVNLQLERIHIASDEQVGQRRKKREVAMAMAEEVLELIMAAEEVCSVDETSCECSAAWDKVQARLRLAAKASP